MLGFELISKVPATAHAVDVGRERDFRHHHCRGVAGPRAPAITGSTCLLGVLAVVFAMINVVGGYLVTDRMLAMFRKKDAQG